jgi:pyruvate kinase
VDAIALSFVRNPDDIKYLPKIKIMIHGANIQSLPNWSAPNRSNLEAIIHRGWGNGGAW